MVEKKWRKDKDTIFHAKVPVLATFGLCGNTRRGQRKVIIIVKLTEEMIKYG